MRKDIKPNKWTRFASEVSFKGMTLNNKAILEYIASKHHSNGVELTFREIGDYVGITKHAARRNVRKMESIGLIKTKNQYGGGYKDALPLMFKINLSWKEKDCD